MPHTQNSGHPPTRVYSAQNDIVSSPRQRGPSGFLRAATRRRSAGVECAAGPGPRVYVKITQGPRTAGSGGMMSALCLRPALRALTSATRKLAYDAMLLARSFGRSLFLLRLRPVNQFRQGHRGIVSPAGAARLNFRCAEASLRPSAPSPPLRKKPVLAWAPACPRAP